jgi:hypothetical protein
VWCRQNEIGWNTFCQSAHPDFGSQLLRLITLRGKPQWTQRKTAKKRARQDCLLCEFLCGLGVIAREAFDAGLST